MDRRTFMAECAVLAATPGFPSSFARVKGAISGDGRAPTHRCLFLDDAHIDQAPGLEVVGHPAKRYPGNPLFVKKFPWEKVRIQLYGRAVVYNAERKLYQMYYIALPNSPHYPNLRVGGAKKVGFVTLPAYAESSDGLHWERPLRRDVSFEDVAETNLLDLNFGQSFEASILWDEHEQDPSRRYKAFIWDQIFELPVPGKLDYRRAAPTAEFPRGELLDQLIRDDSGKIIYERPYNNFGIMVAFSPDGIHWDKHPGWVIPCYSDTGQSALYDSRIGKYVAFGRFRKPHTLAKLYPASETGQGAAQWRKGLTAFDIERNVARIESEDFIHWSEPELVLAGDSEDPESFQINSMPIDFYEGLYVGIMEVDVRPLPNSSPADPTGGQPRWAQLEARRQSVSLH